MRASTGRSSPRFRPAIKIASREPRLDRGDSPLRVLSPTYSEQELSRKVDPGHSAHDHNYRASSNDGREECRRSHALRPGAEVPAGALLMDGVISDELTSLIFLINIDKPTL